MPEALAIVAVLVVAAVICAAMWLRARDPSLHWPHEELARLRHHTTWLEERLARARRENWEHEMVAGLEADLAAATRQLAKAQPDHGTGDQPTTG